jgi:hypothetical protein
MNSSKWLKTKLTTRSNRASSGKEQNYKDEPHPVTKYILGDFAFIFLVPLFI